MRDVEVDDLDFSMLVEQHVFRFDVSMHDVVLMD